MQQMSLFPETELELLNRIHTLKTELGNTRRAAFREINEVKKDYEFLQAQVEILTDIISQGFQKMERTA